MRKIAFLGGYCRANAASPRLRPMCFPPRGGGDRCEFKPGLGQGGKAKGEAGD